MFQNLLCVVAAICVHFGATTFTPCPFMSDCDCETQQDGSYAVYCKKFRNFPVFSSYSGPVSYIEISGNFSSVPARPFAGFQSFTYPSILFVRDFEIGNFYSPLTVDDDAFVTSDPQQTYNSLYFQSFKNMTIPTTALSKPKQIGGVMFWNGDIETVKDNSFQGVQCESLSFVYCITQVIEPNAFAGMNSATSFTIEGGSLTEIPSAIRNTPNVNYLSMAGNQITTLPDNVLCNFSNCTDFLEVSFQVNLISSISDNAFANAANLDSLDLTNNMLSQVPMQALQPIAKTLKTLGLATNKITSLQSNSFYQLEKLKSLTLDYNPITNIEQGAFNGVKFNQLAINNLWSLQSVDFLITYGMPNVKSLAITNCPFLQTITLADYTKLPNTLQNIRINNATDVQTFDPNIQNWLAQSTSHQLDISYNTINCDSSLSWMTNYYLCSPPQLQTTESYCANTKELFSDYLYNFTPSCR